MGNGNSCGCTTVIIIACGVCLGLLAFLGLLFLL